jgi:hypothetical protein
MCICAPGFTGFFCDKILSDSSNSTTPESSTVIVQTASIFGEYTTDTKAISDSTYSNSTSSIINHFLNVTNIPQSSNITYDSSKLSSLYLGCYIDDSFRRDLDRYTYNDNQMTIEMCISVCSKNNYLFAGLSYEY